MKASINDIPKRNQVKLDKQKGIYNNGLDNAYPQRVERLINASVTAKTAAQMLSKFIIGNGFEDETLNSVVISSDIMGDLTLLKLHSQIAQTLSRQNGASIQLQYDMNYKISASCHTPFRNVRFGTTDSNDYSGIMHVYNNWEKRDGIQFDAKKVLKVNTFNPNPDIVKAQFDKYGRDYHGQLAVLRLDDEYIYPLAPIDPALEDADTEAQIKMFKNGELSTGFFAKYILWHTTFANDQEQADFKRVMNTFTSGNHTSSVLMSEGSFDENGNFNQANNFKLEKIEQNINDKIFESYEKSVANNIRKSMYGLPSILIEQQDGAFFGTSGEAFKQAFNFYNTQTKDIRSAVSQWYQEIFKNSANEYLSKANFTIKQLDYGTVDTSGTANV